MILFLISLFEKIFRGNKIFYRATSPDQKKLSIEVFSCDFEGGFYHLLFFSAGLQG